jgi:hypothetical protein
LADTYSNHKGTTSETWQLGGDGPEFKRVGNALALLKEDGVSFAALFCYLLQRQGVSSDSVVRAGYTYVGTDLEICDGCCLEIEDGATVVIL